MRWRSPEHGDSRQRTWFALFPVHANGEWRWLERVRCEQVYQVGVFGDSWWSNARFIDDAGKTTAANSRYFVSGPEGAFYTEDAATAEQMITLFGLDRDEWTVTEVGCPA